MSVCKQSTGSLNFLYLCCKNTCLEFLGRWRVALSKLIFQAGSPPLFWFPMHLAFQGRSDSTAVSPGTDKSSLNQQGDQEEGIDLFFSRQAEHTTGYGLEYQCPGSEGHLEQTLSCLRRFIPRVVFHGS